jgi:hypothetical protein
MRYQIPIEKLLKEKEPFLTQDTKKVPLVRLQQLVEQLVLVLVWALA